MEEGPVAPSLLGAGGLVVAHALLGGPLPEHEGEQGARPLYAVGHALLGQGRRDHLADGLGMLGHRGVDGVVGQLERGQAGRRGQRIPRERARLVDGAVRRQQVHDLRAPADGGQRHPAAHDLPEGHQVRHPGGALAPVGTRPGGGCDVGALSGQARQVRGPAIEGLQAPPAGRTHAEPGEDLIEDHECAVLGGHSADRGVEAGRRWHDPHVGRGSLSDDRGDLAAALGEAGLQGGDVVIGQDDRLGGHRRGYAGAARQAAGGQARAGRREQAVTVPVVAAGELHHQVAAGGAAGQAHGRHRRLGAGGHEAHLLRGRHPAADLLGQERLRGGGGAEGQAAGGGRLDRGDDLRVGVPQQRRTPGAHQVHVAAALGVSDVGAARRGDEPRRTAHRAEGAHGGVHAPGDDGASRLEQGGVGRSGGTGGPACGLRLLSHDVPVDELVRAGSGGDLAPAGTDSQPTGTILPSVALVSVQGRVLGDLPGPVGQDHVGARPHDAQHRLGDDALAVDPPALRGRLHHRVLAADLVGRHRHR